MDELRSIAHELAALDAAGRPSTGAKHIRGYCFTCEVSYCYKHWEFGWFDRNDRICPKGHYQTLSN